MLNMLQRRGPEAFETFIDIIKNDYPWLAATLDMNYKAESDTLNRQNSLVNICTCGSATARTEVDGKSSTSFMIQSIQHENIDQTLVNSLHGRLNC